MNTKAYLLVRYVYIEDYYKTSVPISIFASKDQAEVELKKRIEFGKQVYACQREIAKFQYPDFVPPFSLPERKRWAPNLRQADITPEMLAERAEYKKLYLEYEKARNDHYEERRQARDAFALILPFSQEVKDKALNSSSDAEYGIKEVDFYPA